MTHETEEFAVPFSDHRGKVREYCRLVVGIPGFHAEPLRPRLAVLLVEGDFLDAAYDGVPALLLLLVVTVACRATTLRILARPAAQSTPSRPNGGGSQNESDGEVLHSHAGACFLRQQKSGSE